MSQTSSLPIVESDKRRLTAYLIDRVVEGISGRDGDDIVDAAPSRTIFAGSCQQDRDGRSIAARQEAIGGEHPVGTALGFDFRVPPAPGSQSVRIRITPVSAFTIRSSLLGSRYFAQIRTFRAIRQ